MRRGYSISKDDIRLIQPIMEGIVYRLEQGDLDSIELSIINLGAGQFMEVLEAMGYERDDDWDSNGWEQDTWIYFNKEGHPRLVLFYCGFYGDIRLSISEEEEDE